MQLSENNMEDNLSPRLIAIRSRIDLLIKENNDLAKAQSDIENKYRELKQLAEVQKQTIKDLEDKNKMIRIGQAVSGKENSRELKLKINEAIRDIDKAMGLLGG